jgi:hypothetical protein
MIRKLFLVTFLLLIFLHVRADKKEDLISTLKLIFENNLISDEYLEILHKDSVIQLGHGNKYMFDDEIRFVAGHKNIQINPFVHIFSHAFNDWIRIYNFHHSCNLITMMLDVVINDQIIQQGSLVFIKENDIWQLSKAEMKEGNKENFWINWRSREW